MIVPNIIHPEKRGKIDGTVFHVFFLADNITASVFDKYMDIPIIQGNKNLVKATLRKFNEHLPTTTTRISIFYYKLTPPEFKMKMKYQGLTTTILVPNF
jgi:hypothetical protein